MDSVKEILFAVTLLVGGGFAIEKIHDKVRLMALEKAHKGLTPMTHFTSKLTGINSKNIEKGYLESGQSVDQQISTIEAKEFQVIHMRLAMADENGIELVPGSHFRWDNQKELDVRLQQNGKTSSDKISNSEAIPLKKGDLLVFDANIIHRGLYGRHRFAFDILFCKPLPDITKFIDNSVLPKNEELKSIESPEVFIS